jgi:hypothetical protein
MDPPPKMFHCDGCDYYVLREKLVQRSQHVRSMWGGGVPDIFAFVSVQSNPILTTQDLPNTIAAFPNLVLPKVFDSTAIFVAQNGGAVDSAEPTSVTVGATSYTKRSFTGTNGGLIASLWSGSGPAKSNTTISVVWPKTVNDAVVCLIGMTNTKPNPFDTQAANFGNGSIASTPLSAKLADGGDLCICAVAFDVPGSITTFAHGFTKIVTPAAQAATVDMAVGAKRVVDTSPVAGSAGFAGTPAWAMCLSMFQEL